MSMTFHNRRMFSLVVMGMLASQGLCAGTSYYVNDAVTNGDMYCTAPGHNANDGLSPASPKADIQAILMSYNVEPDDTIWVDTGRYTLCDSITLTLNGNNLIASRSATNAWLHALTYNDGGVVSGTQTLNWAAGGPAQSGTVRLDYSADAGGSWSPMESMLPANVGRSIWHTASYPNTTQALWRIVLEQNTNVWDVNDHVFTISHGGDHEATAYFINDGYTSGDVYCTAPGHNANNGLTPSSPKADLQAILDSYDVEPDDIIWVDTGIYARTNSLVIEGLNGTINAPIRIQGSTNTSAGGSLFCLASSTGGVTVLQGIANGDFETGLEELTVPNEPGTNGWKSYSSSGARGTWDAAIVQTGNYSMQLAVDEGSDWDESGRYALIAHDVDIHNTNHVSGSVSFEGWFQGDLSAEHNGDHPGAFLKMEFLDASLQHIGGIVENEWNNGRPLYGVNTSGEWRRVSIVSTGIPSATAYVRFSVGLNNFMSRLPATGWWDNVSATIQLTGGITTPEDAVLKIQHASLLTLDSLRLAQGIEGVQITGSDDILLTGCDLLLNTTGIELSDSHVRVKHSRIYRGTTGVRCVSGNVDVESCTFRFNAWRQVGLEGGTGTVFNCILSADFGGSVGIQLDNGAVYQGDFNDLYAPVDSWVGRNQGNSVETLTEWQELTGQDQHSLNLNPEFANPGGADFHLKSTCARFNPVLGAWVVDAVDSPCIDTADPSASYEEEPQPNGGHCNMGAYGNTSEASRSSDTDGDRLSNTFELYVLHSYPENPDSDGDGANDGDEFAAGLSCLDAESVFACSPQETTNGVLVLTWPSSSGCVYSVSYAADLISGFTPVANNIQATCPMNTYIVDMQATPGGYYRVTCGTP